MHHRVVAVDQRWRWRWCAIVELNTNLILLDFLVLGSRLSLLSEERLVCIIVVLESCTSSSYLIHHRLDIVSFFLAQLSFTPHNRYPRSHAYSSRVRPNISCINHYLNTVQYISIRSQVDPRPSQKSRNTPRKRTTLQFSNIHPPNLHKHKVYSIRYLRVHLLVYAHSRPVFTITGIDRRVLVGISGGGFDL